MKTIQIEFSKYQSVNFLWSSLIEDYGFDKARKIVSQAIDLQKMNGTRSITMPIIFSGTGGLALIPIQMLEKEEFKISCKENQVLIFNLKKKSFQIIEYDILNSSSQDLRNTENLLYFNTSSKSSIQSPFRNVNIIKESAY